MNALETEKESRLITRSEEPVNLEMPFSSLEDFVTPAERFYVRCHFPIPEIDAQAWRLKVDGAVEQAVELQLDDLRRAAAAHDHGDDGMRGERALVSPAEGEGRGVGSRRGGECEVERRAFARCSGEGRCAGRRAWK